MTETLKHSCTCTVLTLGQLRTHTKSMSDDVRVFVLTEDERGRLARHGVEDTYNFNHLGEQAIALRLIG